MTREFAGEEPPSDGGGDSAFPPPSSDSATNSAEPVIEDFLAASDTIPGYQLVREIHRGGQGVVYQAIQKSTQAFVAVKVMREGPFASPAERARFEREVRTLAQVRHPAIVSIHDSGVAAGVHYFVMDYIGGHSLSAWISLHALAPHGKRRSAGRGPSPHEDLRRTLELFVKICHGVNAAHKRGIIHRDLKPANVVIDPDGDPHVLDFGLAKSLSAAFTGGEQPPLMTATGQFVGSLPWASPEQAEGQPGKLDARSDVYALGVILYQMLTGAFPYPVIGPMRVVVEHILHTEPMRPSRVQPSIDADLDTILLKCLSKDRERRYLTAGDLARDIEHYLAGEPIEARRESTVYLLRKQADRLARRNRFALLLMILIGSIAVARMIGYPFVLKWTAIDTMFRNSLVALVDNPNRPAKLEFVRVIALEDDTDGTALARRLGVEGVVDTRETQSTLRGLHGALFERLARANPAVVVSDITFNGEKPPFDEGLLKGIRALRNANSGNGAPFIVAVRDWELDHEGLPPTSRTLIGDVRWGPVPSDVSESAPWSLELAMQRSAGDVRSSLALTTVAQYRHPFSEFSATLDPAQTAVFLQYWKPNPKIPHARALIDDAPDRVNVTAIDIPRGQLSADQRATDSVAHYQVRLFDNEAIRAATTSYAEFFDLTDQELRRFEGRIVLLGNCREGIDEHRTPDGRTLAGVFAHAFAIEDVLQSVSRRIPTALENNLSAPVVALVGLWFGIHFAGRPGRRTVAMLALALACLGFAFYLYAAGRIVADPAVHVLAAWIACELAARVPREPRAEPA